MLDAGRAFLVCLLQKPVPSMFTEFVLLLPLFLHPNLPLCTTHITHAVNIPRLKYIPINVFDIAQIDCSSIIEQAVQIVKDNGLSDGIFSVILKDIFNRFLLIYVPLLHFLCLLLVYVSLLHFLCMIFFCSYYIDKG